MPARFQTALLVLPLALAPLACDPTKVLEDAAKESGVVPDDDTARLMEFEEMLNKGAYTQLIQEMPAYLDSFTSPANDPSKTQESYRQAGSIIAMLRGEGEYSGRSFLVVMALLTVLAFAWGAGHALMPGHAKTVVAAYLISQKGTYWHAILLAIVVTITHTALVVIVGLVIWAVAAAMGAGTFFNVGWTLVFMFLTSFGFALFGLAAGILAKDFDHINFVPSFLLLPLTFLGGVFYSVKLLPSPWDQISLFNPIVYMVNGLRYGMTGVSDVPVMPGFAIVLASVLVGAGIVAWLLSTGRGLKP